MCLLDEDAGNWYCYKDDELFYTKEPPKELRYGPADGPQAAALVYVGEIVLGAIVILVILHGWLIPQGMISRENSELGFWLLVLPIDFIILSIHSLISGQELKIGKSEYTLSRRV